MSVWRSRGDVGLIHATGDTLAEAFVALVAELQANDEEQFIIDIRFAIEDKILLTAVLEFDDGVAK